MCIKRAGGTDEELTCAPKHVDVDPSRDHVSQATSQNDNASACKALSGVCWRLSEECAPLRLSPHDVLPEEEIYMLQPANKTDHLCQLWQ